MTTTLDIHREQRELLLAGIANELAMDEHFLGGGLTGCYAGSEAGALCDIVVADVYSEVLMRELKDRVSEFIDAASYKTPITNQKSSITNPNLPCPPSISPA